MSKLDTSLAEGKFKVKSRFNKEETKECDDDKFGELIDKMITNFNHTYAGFEGRSKRETETLKKIIGKVRNKNEQNKA